MCTVYAHVRQEMLDLIVVRTIMLTKARKIGYHKFHDQAYACSYIKTLHTNTNFPRPRAKTQTKIAVTLM